MFAAVQVLAAAGAVNHDELVKLASDAFGSVPDEDAATSVRSLLVKVSRTSVEEWGQKEHDNWARAQGTAIRKALVRLGEAPQNVLGRLEATSVGRRLSTKQVFMHCVLAMRAAPQEPSRFTGSYVHDRFPDASECCMAVAFKGASWTDPDSIPLMVMQTMLGGCSGARREGATAAAGGGHTRA